MRIAIIYFEGKEICYIDFDSISQLCNPDGIIMWTRFMVGKEEVGFFVGNYCYNITNVK